MNTKTAKKLRKIAYGMVVAAQEKGKEIKHVSYQINKAGTVTVAKDTWKGAYKSLKNGLRHAKHGSAFHQELTSVSERIAATKQVAM